MVRFFDPDCLYFDDDQDLWFATEAGFWHYLTGVNPPDRSSGGRRATPDEAYAPYRGFYGPAARVMRSWLEASGLLLADPDAVRVLPPGRVSARFVHLDIESR